MSIELPPKRSGLKNPTINFRLPPSLLARLGRVASERGYSRNALVVMLLGLALAELRPIRTSKESADVHPE